MKFDTTSTTFHLYCQINPSFEKKKTAGRPSYKEHAKYIMGTSQFLFFPKFHLTRTNLADRPTLGPSKNPATIGKEVRLGQTFAFCMKDTQVLIRKLSWNKVLDNSQLQLK